MLVLKHTEVFLPLETVIDIATEKQHLEKQLDDTRNDFARIKIKLDDPQFTSKADPSVVEREHQRLVMLKDKLTRLEEWLTQLN